jgi:hypothetical protein
MERTKTARLKLTCARGVFVLAVLAVACASIAAAQEEKKPEAGSLQPKQQPLPKGGPTPRTADGHPDLSGVWFPGTTGGYSTSSSAAQRQFDAKVTPEEKPPFQPWAAA